MDLNRFETCFLLLCWIVLIGNGCCDSKLKESPSFPQDAGSLAKAPEPDQLHFDVNAFRLSADFILHLNELIQSMATFALDGSFETRAALDMAENEWNRTERILADLLQSKTNGNATVVTALQDSLNAIRMEKINFMAMRKLLVNSTTAVGDNSSDLNALVDTSETVELPLSLILHPSIAGLTQVSADLLRSMSTNGIQQEAQPRAKGTAPSIQDFLIGFARKFRETKRIIAIEAKRYLMRTKVRLSVLPDSTDVANYIVGLANITAVFVKREIHILHNASRDIYREMTINGSMLVDQQLRDGLSQLLTNANSEHVFSYLELCLKRYVYKYYDQSQALSKLLYCGQPEASTLDYLDAVFGTILQRAAITDSSPILLTVICSMGSTDCTDNYYNSLPTKLNLVRARFNGYADFIQREMDDLVHRITVCVQSTVFEIAAYAMKTETNFVQCVNTGKVN